MKFSSFAQVASATALACTLSLSAVAAPNADGATTNDIVAALQQGLSVEADKDKPDMLFAQGKNHLIGVWGTACDGARCRGITYLSVLKVAPSKEAANKYNSDGSSFSKLYINPKGKAFLVIDQVVFGGVTPANILNNALMLMAETSEYLAKFDSVAAAQPSSNAATLSANLGVAANQRLPENLGHTMQPIPVDAATRLEIKAAAAERQ